MYNLRSLKICNSIGVIYVGSLPCRPVLWCTEVSAVITHAPHTPTATSSTRQGSTTYECTTVNGTLRTTSTWSWWPPPSNAMWYLNLQVELTVLDVCFINYINADKQTGQLMHWEASKYWLLFSVSLDSGYCCDAFEQYTAKCCIQTFASHRGKIWSIYLAGVGTLYFTNFVCRVDSLSRRSAMRSKVSTGWSLLGSD